MTTAPTASIAANVRRQWDHSKGSREGRVAFSRMIGQMAPYSGTIGAEVVELERGYAKIQMQDRREVRNHLNSVHALAVSNLAELTSGLAMLYSVPENARSIITGLSVEFVKKARGILTAECSCDVPETNQRREYQFEVNVKDATRDLVAKATVRWLVGPEETKT